MTDQIALEDVKSFAAGLSPWAHLASVGADGKPDVVPVHPCWEGDICWVMIGTDSVKARNVAAHADVAMHWQVDAVGDGVEIWGTAEVFADLDTKRRLWTGVFDYDLNMFAPGGPDELTRHRVPGHHARAGAGAQAVRNGRNAALVCGMTSGRRLTELSRSIEGQGRDRHRGGEWNGSCNRSSLRRRRCACRRCRPPASMRSMPSSTRSRAVHGDGVALGRRRVTSPTTRSCASLVDDTIAWAGGIDIVVNNAGVSLVNSMFQDEAEFEDNWARTLDVNLTAHARLIRLAVPHLIESGSGRIVNIASTESIVATAGLAAYAASKAGVTGLTRALGRRARPPRRDGQLHLSGPDRHRDDRSDPAGSQGHLRPPAGAPAALRRSRGGGPHDAQPVPAVSSSFVNGATIAVDGGMTIRHT